MAEIKLTAAELETLAKELQPFLKSVPTPPDSGTNPPQPPNPPVITPPIPRAKVSARWDSAPSQWAKWRFVRPDETEVLTTLFGFGLVANHIAWYQGGGGGGIALYGRYNTDNTYEYVDPDWPYYPAKFVKDVDGAADAVHAMLCKRNNKSEMSPLG